VKGDTIWLECTSQLIPFGFLGDFTSDRQVLLIKNDGGVLARTPAYVLKDNFQYTHATVTLTSDGNATAEISRKFGGLQFSDNMGSLHLNTEDQKNWLYNYIKLPNFKINRYKFKQDNPDIPESVLDVSLNINAYGSSSGKRIFMPVNLINRTNLILPKIKKRWSNIEKLVPYIDTDSIEYMLPEGIEVEFLPPKSEIATPFGTYISSVTLKNNKLTYFRQIKMFKGIYPKELYDDLMKFYRDIDSADKCQAVFMKKEG
jgi:hypothetical protein